MAYTNTPYDLSPSSTQAFQDGNALVNQNFVFIAENYDRKLPNHVKQALGMQSQGEELWLLVPVESGNNECIGRIYNQRSSGHYEAFDARILISTQSGGRGAAPESRASIETTVLRNGRQATLRTCDYEGTTYFCLAWTGGSFMTSAAFFDGYILGDGNRLKNLLTTEVTNLSEPLSSSDTTKYIYHDLDVIGDTHINGALSKGSGSFKIDHPLKPDTHYLVHSFVEAPQADNIYRGRVSLVDGRANVNLDTASRMSEGTFTALNTNIQCFTTNETSWDAVRGSVVGNTLIVESQNLDCTDTISWLVIGERCDQHMIEANWTDESGRVITEPIRDK